jgi:hypothetical protein
VKEAGQPERRDFRVQPFWDQEREVGFPSLIRPNSHVVVSHLLK